MRIGVDVGGTKLEAAAIRPDGSFAVRQRRPTPAKDYDKAIEAIAGLVEEVAARAGVAPGHPVGFGIPGAISPATGTVKNAYNSPFNGRPLDRDLGARMGRPVRMLNDANCFALSEARDGAAAGATVVFGAILGTGCGGGVVVDGTVLVGPNAVAGEWGHNPLPWPADDERPGLACDCGKRGCIETFLAGTGLERHFAAATGTKLPAHEIVARAEAGDAAAEAGLARYEDRLARALASVINLLDPDVIVFGGGMSNVARLYRTVPALWGEWVFSDRVDTRLVPPKYGDSSGVRGAAWLWPEDGTA